MNSSAAGVIKVWDLVWEIMSAESYSSSILSGNIIRNHFNFRITFANQALNGINWIKTDIIRNLGWVGYSAQLYVSRFLKKDKAFYVRNSSYISYYSNIGFYRNIPHSKGKVKNRIKD